MSISLQEMQRELHHFAMAEMRNRGLEEAACLMDQTAINSRIGAQRFDFDHAAKAIRALKTDPREHLSNWWADNPTVTNGHRESPQGEQV